MFSTLNSLVYAVLFAFSLGMAGSLSPLNNSMYYSVSPIQYQKGMTSNSSTGPPNKPPSGVYLAPTVDLTANAKGDYYTFFDLFDFPFPKRLI